jgi:hypothetical protein
MTLSRLAVLLNGVYDVLCFAGILLNVPVLGTLHAGVFIDEPAPLTKRILAYWILTYGAIRVMAGVSEEPVITLAAAATYFIEAIAFEGENFVFGSVVWHKVRLMTLLTLPLTAPLLPLPL